MVLGLGLIGAPVASGTQPGHGSGVALVARVDQNQDQNHNQNQDAARSLGRVPVSTPIGRANSALARAIANVNSHRPYKAAAALRAVRRHVSVAHGAAMGLIGKPPTDPESDDPPGPPAVISVLALEHRVTKGVVPLFDRRRSGPYVVRTLRVVLAVAHHRRNVMLHRVIALPPEGAGSDYSDGMSDTVGIYPAEVRQVSSALKTYRLTAAARAGLRRALSRVRATNARFQAAYGGGE
jgi:hypothetical protein